LTLKPPKASFFRPFQRFPYSVWKHRMNPPRHASSKHKPEEKKDAEDVFVEKILEAMKWAKANTQVLVFAGVVAVALIAGGTYYRNWKSAQTERAVAQLEQVQQSVAFGEREVAKASLNQFIDAFAGTPYELEARLLLGQVLLEEGNPEEAIDALASAVREMKSEPIGIQAAFLIAAAYEEAGRIDEAERMFLRISNTAELTFQIREAVGGAARIRADQGNFSGAAELYAEVLDGMEDSDPEKSYWEMRLAEASARG
jgi:predicted negative regulator of RcsB-dependent stress response